MTTTAPPTRTGRAHQQPAPPTRFRWGQHTTGWAAAAVLSGGLTHLVGQPTGWVVTLACLAVAVAVALLGWRTNHRAERAYAALLVTRHRLVGVADLKGWRVRWRGWPGRPTHVTVQFLSTTPALEAFRLQLVEALNIGWQLNFTVTTLDLARGRAKLAARPVDDTPAPAGQELVDRATDVTRQVFGAKATLSKPEIGDGDLQAFTVKHQAGVKLSSPEVRMRVEDVVSSMLPGRWRASYDLPADTVRFSRRPDLPVMVPRPTNPVDPNDKDFLQIPQAVDEDGNLCAWDISGVMAHQLKAGRTRTGKTVSLIGDTVEAARRGFRVCVIDPKRIEFLGLRDWPNVELVATNPRDQVVLINYWYREMMDRYRRIEEEGARETDFTRALVVIDEYRQLHTTISAWWKSIKVTGMPTACPIFDEISSMLRLAAAARIHVVMGTQRPDSEFVGGETRDNFSSRAALGALSPEGSRMMFDSHTIGTRTPRGRQGRGTWAGDGSPKEVQYFYTPDPRKATSPADLALLAALRPHHTTWPRQQIVYPTAEQVAALVAEHPSKIAPDWVAILNATLEPLPTQDPQTPPAVEDTTDPPTQTPTDQTPDEDEPGGQWATPQLLPAHRLGIGDMVEHDQGWGTITNISTDEDEPDQLLLTWLSDDGTEDAVIALSDEECLLARALLDD